MMKIIDRGGLKVFVIQNHHAKTAGMSRYKNVVVVWDEDYDERVLTFIDDYLRGDEEQFKNLIAVHESEGTLSLFFFGFVPHQFEAGESVEVENDSWMVAKARAIRIRDVI